MVQRKNLGGIYLKLYPTMEKACIKAQRRESVNGLSISWSQEGTKTPQRKCPQELLVKSELTQTEKKNKNKKNNNECTESRTPNPLCPLDMNLYGTPAGST